MNELKTNILEFLYKWTEESKIPHIRKGMVEDLEAFVASIIAEKEAQQMAERMAAKSAENDNK